MFDETDQADFIHYCNASKYKDRWVGANNVDPDETSLQGAVWPGSSPFAIWSASFEGITV